MRRFRAALVAALLACTLTGITLPAPALTPFPFTIIDAPNAGPKGTQVESINDAGQMVGAFTDAGDKIHGFLRTSTGAFVTIDVPGAASTYAAGINDAGRIVGGFDDAGGKTHGFLRTTTGALTTFDAPGAIVTQGVRYQQRRADRGRLSSGGTASNTVSCARPAGPLPSLTAPGRAGPPLPASTMPGKSSDGMESVPIGKQREPRLLARRDRRPYDHQRELSGLVRHEANSINDTGLIVGDFFGADGSQHGFLRTATGAFATIDVPGRTDVEVTASSINHARQIVGWFVESYDQYHGFVTAR